jgi:hypothetical protein
MWQVHNLTVMRMLLNAGARTDAVDAYIQSPLVAAAIDNRADVCDLLIEHKANLHREMQPALRFAMQHYTEERPCGAHARAVLGYANKAGAAFTSQAQHARDQHVASHWTDSPLFDWHLVREITQYIEYRPKLKKKEEKKG